MKPASTITEARSPATVVVHQPREPPNYRGSSYEDPESWLDIYDRVAALNKWEPDDKLRHVHLYLEDAARTWFQNRESTLRTLDDFRAAFLPTFASVARKERAASLLETRVQLPNENVTVFTEEMTWLFRRTDADMPEDKKVRLLMRGVKQELFAGLIRHPPKTVQEFLSEATTIEKTLEIRTRRYNHRMCPDIAEVQAFGRDDLRETIRAIVREELRVMFSSSQPQVASLEDIVREEVQRSLSVPEPPTPQPEAMTYAAAARRSAAAPRPR